MIPTIVYSAAAVTVIHAQVAPAIAQTEAGHRATPSGDHHPNLVPLPATETWTISDSQALYLHPLAKRTARRLGLDHHTAEDCAGQFVAFMLTPPLNRQLQAAFAQGSIGWLFRCAENSALNYRRQVRAQGAREVSWTSFEGNVDANRGENRPPWNPATTEGNPEAELLRSELKLRILDAARRLPAGQFSLLFRWLFEGEGEPDRVRDQPRSSGAVRNARWKLRKRLRRLLSKAGISSEEVHGYLELLNRA